MCAKKENRAKVKVKQSGDSLSTLTIVGRVLLLPPCTFLGVIILVYVTIKRFQEGLSGETEAE